MDFTKRHDEMTLYKTYDPETYPKYDNYDAIECGKSPNVPCDYEESWGIPLDIEIDENKWEKLYDGKGEDGETYQWVVPAEGTELADKFQSKEDGYVDEITAELSLSLSLIRYRNGVIGVPISFLNGFYSPGQFKIRGLDRYVPDNPNYGHRFRINNEEIYARVLIMRRRRVVQVVLLFFDWGCCFR